MNKGVGLDVLAIWNSLEMGYRVVPSHSESVRELAIFFPLMNWKAICYTAGQRHSRVPTQSNSPSCFVNGNLMFDIICVI
jgi:hypothetical protein